MTLVQRTLEVLASETDDFFEKDRVAEYLNMVLVQMVSRLNSLERDSVRSLRSLDELRKELTENISGVANSGSFYTGTIAVPQDLFQVQYAEYNNKTPLREIPTNKLFSLRWGNAVPTSAEGYYVFTTTGDGRVIRYYVHSNADDVPVSVYYLRKPTDLTKTSTTLADLPDQFIAPLIYGAAELASIKENARESADNALAYRKYGEKFEQYFQAAVF